MINSDSLDVGPQTSIGPAHTWGLFISLMYLIMASAAWLLLTPSHNSKLGHMCADAGRASGTPAQCGSRQVAIDIDLLT